MATKNNKSAKNAQNKNNESKNANNQFASVFTKCKNAEEAKNVLDYVIKGYTDALEAKFGKAEKAEKPAEKPAKKSTKADTKSKKEGKKATKKAEDEVIVAISDKKALKKLGLAYHDYSEKSFAITGDTKPIRHELKKMGGRYNGGLSCGAGWIFSKEKSAGVPKMLGLKAC